MNIRNFAIASLAAATGSALSAAPVASNVAMTQDSSRVVTITYALSDGPAVVTLDIQTNANAYASADDSGWTSIGGEAVCNAQGDVWKKIDSASGTITWRPDLSWPGHKIEDSGARAVVTAWPLENTPDYMVVDISSCAQPNAQTYYPAADFLPGGVLGNSDYRTTALVMRKIMAKGVSWRMGSTTAESRRNADREDIHVATLANNYYIGVFPITQSQWSLVATNSSVEGFYTVERDMRAMELVSYNEIRLKANSNAAATADEISNYSWPKDPHPSSYLGLLRLKTGLDFDLPSEAQWEFAARAGNGSGCWGDGSAILDSDEQDANLGLQGRYSGNAVGNGGSSTCEVTGGTAIVGTYRPNDWGLYDMFGNVCEWCLDWHEDNISAHGGNVNISASNPANNLSGTAGADRVRRGGSWYHNATTARPACRSLPSTATRRGREGGLRVVCTAGLE